MSKASDKDDYVYGIPAYPQYVLLHAPPTRSPSRASCWTLCSPLRITVAALVILSLAGAGFVVWPRKPDVDIRKVTLEKIGMHMDDSKSIIPSVTMDLSLSLLLKITNTNFFGVNYDSVVVHFSYRGDELGKVRSQGGEVPPRSTSLAVALLDLEGLQLLKHVSDLIVDLSNNQVPIETKTVFSGAVEILTFRPQIEVTVYCKMIVDPKEKIVVDQDCALDF